MTDIRREILGTRLGEIEAAIAGEGPPVLALHGGMGGYDQGLILARATFTAPARIVAVSRPGYLGTPLADARTPDAQADLYAAALDTLGIAQAHVVAVSAGGPSALAFARRHPARCAGVVLVSCCTGRLEIPPEVRKRMPMMKWFARIPGFAWLLRRRAAKNPARAARRSIPDPEMAARTLADPESGPLFRALLSGTFERLRERLPGTLNDMAVFARQSDIAGAEIAAPLLIVHGDADRIVAFAHASRLAGEAPNAALMRIAGGEHVCLFTHMRAVRDRVAAFAG